jgi:hypothetical protein
VAVGAPCYEAPMGINRLMLRLLVALGIFVCILNGWSAVYAARALLRAPEKPVPSTVAAAPDFQWVTLEDAVLDCSTHEVRQRATLVLANDRSGAHPFLAELAGTKACDHPSSGPIDGAFIGPVTRVYRERQIFPFLPGGDLRVFSQNQAPRYLKRALARRLTWFAMSLLLTTLAIWAVWTSDAPRPARPTVTKSGRAPGRG